MRPVTFIFLLLTSLLLTACILQPTPEPPPPTEIVGTPVIRIADTPTPDPVSTPTPGTAQSRGGLQYQVYASPPLMGIDPAGTYTAKIITNKGEMELGLFPAQAPETVNNFVFLAREGFYDGLIFHRVIPGFMIQGGDPTGTGTGGPGYKFRDEFHESLVFNKPGILAMANAGPGTNGSQFFVTVAPTPHLTGRHTIFGEVTAGQEVADAISLVPRGHQDRPVDPVIIQTIEITER